MPNSSNNPDPALGPAALHAPWRQSYVETADAQHVAGPSTGSFLLDYWLSPSLDLRNHVVARTPAGLILLNRFPYTGGHLLVALGDARPCLSDYSAGQRAALWQLVDSAADLIERSLSPQGINIGINQGRAAGAGVPQHLHVHLVPRWSGDVNFMSAVAQVRVLPTSLESMASRYRETWNRTQGEKAP